jgi:hypothetical protein
VLIAVLDESLPAILQWLTQSATAANNLQYIGCVGCDLDIRYACILFSFNYPCKNIGPVAGLVDASAIRVGLRRSDYVEKELTLQLPAKCSPHVRLQRPLILSL